MPRRVASGSTRPAKARAPNIVPMGKSAWRAPTPKFGRGTARFRGLIVFGHGGCPKTTAAPPRRGRRRVLRQAVTLFCLRCDRREGTLVLFFPTRHHEPEH